MRDFSLKLYHQLLEVLIKANYEFVSYSNFIEDPKMKKMIILRHDVDHLPKNSYQFASIEKKFNIKSTYFFRVVPTSFNIALIKKISDLGFEIGYHYEDIVMASKYLYQKAKHSSDYEKYLADIAIETFSENLKKFRILAPVTTICMHGSPMNKWDSRILWKYYDYRDYGIKGEPYFDVNFESTLYLTDTGRRWNGSSVAMRDKASMNFIKEKGKYRDWQVKPIVGSLMNMSQKSLNFQNSHSYNSTFDLIKAAEVGKLPNKVMMTLHPQRWSDKYIPWIKELYWQNIKNYGKYFLVRWRNN